MANSSSSNHAAPHEADPAHEVFDLVDDTGAVIGQEARAVVHKLGLLHRAGEDAQQLQLLSSASSCMCIAAHIESDACWPLLCLLMQFMCLF